MADPEIAVKPVGQGGRKPREVVPSGPAARRNDEVLETVVTRPALAVPCVERREGDLVSLVGQVVVQQRFPDEELVGHPDTAVPVAVRAVIGRRTVDGRNAGVGPQPVGRKNVFEDALRLRGRTDARHEGADAVETLVEIRTVPVPEERHGATRLVVHHIAEIPCFVVPRIALDGVGEHPNVAVVLRDVAPESHLPGLHAQDFRCAQVVRGSHHRRH